MKQQPKGSLADQLKAQLGLGQDYEPAEDAASASDSAASGASAPSSSSAMRSENYDLIVSNPPYFNNSLKNPSKGKATARHTDSLSYKDLVSNAVQLLKDDGMFAVIIPALEYDNFLELAHRHFLYEREIVRVYSKHSDIDAKRVILLLAKGLQRERIARKIYLEEADRTRSAEYGALTKDYYL